MLVFGKISKINYDQDVCKLQVEDIGADGADGSFTPFETPWLMIPHLWTGVNTSGNKSGRTLEVQTLAAAILTEDMTEGILLGCKYNDKDTVIAEFKGKDYIHFADGLTLIHEPNSNKLKITGDIEVDGNITSSKDISDKKGTVQSIRDWANAHTHSNGYNGANTGSPTSQI